MQEGKRLSVRYLESAPNREKRQDIAKFVESNLEAVGFDVDVVFGQSAPQQAEAQQNRYDIFGLSLVAVDPGVLNSIYHPRFAPSPEKFGFDLSHTDDAELTATLTRAQRSADPEERVKAYAEAQQEVVGNARSVAVYVPTYTVALNGLTGLRCDAEGYPVFYDTERTG